MFLHKYLTILALSPFDNAVLFFYNFTFVVGSPFDPSGNLFYLIYQSR